MLSKSEHADNYVGPFPYYLLAGIRWKLLTIGINPLAFYYYYISMKCYYITLMFFISY